MFTLPTTTEAQTPAQPVEFTWAISASDPSWITAWTLDGQYTAALKVFEYPSHWGLLCGRISKITIAFKGEETFAYDRGSFEGYLDQRGRELLKSLAMKFN